MYDAFSNMKDIILYGTGLDGEKFFYRSKGHYKIVYCIDQRKRNAAFHGIPVFHLEEKVQELKNHLVVVAATDNTWKEIRKILINKGLQEFSDFINAKMIGKKIAVVYGNCHMRALCEYLQSNYFFQKDYYISYHYIGEYECPDSAELTVCDVLISQDIQKNNEFHMPGADTLCRQLGKKARKIIVPNLYGCNLFFPQCYFPADDQLHRHLGVDAIDSDTYDTIKAQGVRVIVESIGKRDCYIDESYKKGYSVEDIRKHITDDIIWDEEEIRQNFSHQMMKFKEREKKCDIIISDYIERFYQQMQLFYEPFHPTETVIAEKGRKILELLRIPQDEEIPLRRFMGAMEMPVYGCVKKALGLQFEQKILRRGCSTTLNSQPESLEEYIEDYLVWVWGNPNVFEES